MMADHTWQSPPGGLSLRNERSGSLFAGKSVMRAADLQKVLETILDTATDAFDHMARRFTDAAENLGDEYTHLAEFSAGWAKLSKKGRKVFVEQLLKSSGLVIASTLATKAGLKFADKQQKQIRNVVLMVADFVKPAAEKARKKVKKAGKRAKKKLKEAVG